MCIRDRVRVITESMNVVADIFKPFVSLFLSSYIVSNKLLTSRIRNTQSFTSNVLNNVIFTSRVAKSVEKVSRVIKSLILGSRY